MVGTIDQFRAQLIGGGARPNQFKVEIVSPPGITTGDREFADTWSTTFINDTNFALRNAFERWNNGINDLVTGTGVTSSSEYQADLKVSQLDRDDSVLKVYIFRNAFPLTVGQIDLSTETTNAIEEFEVTWRYQHFESSEVTAGISAVAG